MYLVEKRFSKVNKFEAPLEHERLDEKPPDVVKPAQFTSKLVGNCIYKTLLEVKEWRGWNLRVILLTAFTLGFSTLNDTPYTVPLVGVKVIPVVPYAI